MRLSRHSRTTLQLCFAWLPPIHLFSTINIGVDGFLHFAEYSDILFALNMCGMTTACIYGLCYK